MKFVNEHGPTADVMIYSPSHALRRIRVDLQNGEVDLGRIVLGIGERISGHVRDTDGKGIPRATISVRLQDDEFGEWVELKCEADGRFEFDSASKDALYYLSVHLPIDDDFMNYKPTVESFRENVPAGSHNLEFTFKRP